MAEFITGPLPDDVALQGTPFETTPGEVQSANVGNVWNALPVVRETNAFTRSTLARQAVQQAGPAVDPRSAGSDADAASAERGDGPDTTQVQPEDANKRLPPGMTPFSHPVSQGTLDSMVQDHQEASQRADVIARNGNSILSGGLARFGVGALVSLADPLNDVAMMLPVAPEAWIAGKMATAGGIFGRAGIRAAEGGAQGALGMAALQPLEYGQDIEDHTAWSLGEALQNVAFGAALGAGGHALLGGLFGERVAALPAETRAAALHVGLADVMADRPVGVSDLLDHGEATAAADRLEKFQATRLASEPALEPDVSTLDRGTVIADHEASLASLRSQADELRGENEALRTKAITGGMDAETAARLDDVQHELGQTIPKARRAALEQERTMLLEGRGNIDVTPLDLEGARTQSQIQATTAIMARTTQAIAKTEADLAEAVARDATAQADAQAARVSADRTTRIQQARVDSRENMLQSLMEREVRKYADRIGVGTLEPGEAATIAREIRTAQPGEVRDTIASHLNALARRTSRPDVRGAINEMAPSGTPIKSLRAEANGAARDMATKRMNPTADPDIAATEKANDAAISRAPKLDEIADKDAAEVDKMLANKKADYDALAKFTESEEPASLTHALEAADNIEKEAKAAADYASCIVARGA